MDVIPSIDLDEPVAGVVIRPRRKIRIVGDHYNNNDWLFVDDSDVLDISRAFVQAKTKMRAEFDIVKMPQTRERRRVVGDYAVSVYDVMGHRRYPDTISYHKS